MKPERFQVVAGDEKLLHVHLNPAVKLEEFFHLFAEIRQLADSRRVQCILIDARAFRGKVSTVQRLQLALALVDQFLGCRVAGVISAESFDARRLAETMTRNRGGNVKMTTSLPEALKWLGVRAAPGDKPLPVEPRAR